MNNTRQISEKVYWIGVNDRNTSFFESLWPLPNGVAYNCYLIKDKKTVLLDTVKLGSTPDFTGTVEHLLEGRDLDYLVVNHVELDHTGEIASIMRRYPALRIIGNSVTRKMLSDYYDLGDSFVEVKDGETLSLGSHELVFYTMPWVHWPEVMVTYDKTEKILFSADAFGSFGTLDGGIFDDELDFRYYEGEMLRYYSNIVGKFSSFVQKAIAKFAPLEIKMICPLHGMLWRKDPAKVVSLYDKWSRYEADDAVVIIFGSMYGNTSVMADALARELSAAGVKDIRVYDVTKTHASYLISEIWRCKGVMLGSCAYNAGMFPLMDALAADLLNLKPQGKYLGLFGSFTWSGGGVRKLQEFAANIGWEMVYDCYEMKGRASSEKLAGLKELAVAMSSKIIEK